MLENETYYWSFILQVYLISAQVKHLLSLPQAGTLVIKETVEPLLEDYRPPGITSLKFSKLSLGTVAPKIEGMEQMYHLCCISLFPLLAYSQFSDDH